MILVEEYRRNYPKWEIILCDNLDKKCRFQKICRKANRIAVSLQPCQKGERIFFFNRETKSSSIEIQ